MSGWHRYDRTVPPPGFAASGPSSLCSLPLNKLSRHCWSLVKILLTSKQSTLEAVERLVSDTGWVEWEKEVTGDM